MYKENILYSGERVRFDLRTEIGLVQQLTKQAIPVIINECIVRGFYMIRRLCLEISSKDIQKLAKKVNNGNRLIAVYREQ